MKLVLASTSKFKSEILNKVHLTHTCIKNDYNENNIIKQNVYDYVKKLSYEKAKNVMQNSGNDNIIYTVQYVATIKDNILSLIIKSNLKEGDNAQRVIIQTYNYDILQQKKVTLEDILNAFNDFDIIQSMCEEMENDMTCDNKMKKIVKEKTGYVFSEKELRELDFSIYNKYRTKY